MSKFQGLLTAADTSCGPGRQPRRGPWKDRGSYGADIATGVTQSCYRPVDPAVKCHQSGASRRALPRFPSDDPRSRHRDSPATARGDASASGLPHRCRCCLEQSLRSFAPGCGWSKERTRPRSVVAVAENTGKGAVAVRGWLSFVAYATDQGAARSALPARPPASSPPASHSTSPPHRRHPAQPRYRPARQAPRSRMTTNLFGINRLEVC